MPPCCRDYFPQLKVKGFVKSGNGCPDKLYLANPPLFNVAVNYLIVDSVLTNAKAYLNGQIVDCSIAIEEDKIFKIGKETQMPSADQKN